MHSRQIPANEPNGGASPAGAGSSRRLMLSQTWSLHSLCCLDQSPKLWQRARYLHMSGKLQDRGAGWEAENAPLLVHFLKTCCVRAFAGSATLQRGFWSRAGARRSQDNAQALLWRCTSETLE